MEFLKQLFSSDDFMPHGYCYLWNPWLVWLHVISDILITLAYLSIPITLIYFVRKRRDVPFHWMFLCFGTFIVACGATHAMEVWNLWHAAYWLAGGVKAITALASVPTAVLLVQLIPKALALPTSETLRKTNKALAERAEMMDSASEAITIRDPDLTVRYWNRGAERIYGWRREELLGKEVNGLLQTVFPKPLDEIRADLLREGHWEGELHQTKRDGMPIVVESRWTLQRDEHGTPVAILATSNDVTPRKQVEDALRQSEERYRSVVDTANDAFVTMDAGGKIKDWNRQAESIFGWSRAQAIGRLLSETIIPQRYREQHLRGLRHFMATGQGPVLNKRIEITALHRAGHEFPVELTIVALKQGPSYEFNSFVHDITERKRAEDALRLSEERFRVLVDGVKDYAIFRLDLEGHVATWNAGAERIKGYGAEEIVGKHFSKFYSQEDIDLGKPAAGLRAAAAEGRFEDEGWRLRKDGSRFWANVVFTALRDEKGELAGFAKITRDFTERKQSEERIRQLNEVLERRARELEAANNELEAFTYSVSHDLRAPLRHVDGFSRLLLEDHAAQLNPEGRRFLERIREGTQNMGELVDDLLNLSRISRRELTPQANGLSGIVENVLADLKPTLEGRNIEFRVAPLPSVVCDAGLLKVVLTNLLANAIKFTRPRECALIEVGTTRKDGNLAVFVRDNGVGFDMKHAEKLFGVFQRLHRQEDFEGTGVGLALVKRIIEKHGGKVWAEAAIDRGGTFYFTLEAGENSGARTARVATGVGHDNE